jgi:hypothetical protein
MYATTLCIYLLSICVFNISPTGLKSEKGESGGASKAQVNRVSDSDLSRKIAIRYARYMSNMAIAVHIARAPRASFVSAC